MKMFKMIRKIVLCLVIAAVLFSCGEVAETLKTITAQEQALLDLSYMADGTTALRLWSIKPIAMNFSGIEIDARYQPLDAGERLTTMDLGAINFQPKDNAFYFTSMWFLERAGADNKYHIRHGATGQYIHIQGANDAVGAMLQLYWGAAADAPQTVFTAKADADGNISFLTENGNAITITGLSDTIADTDRITSATVVNLQDYTGAEGQKFKVEKLPVQPKIWGGKCYIQNGQSLVDGETATYYLKSNGDYNGATLALTTNRDLASVWWITFDDDFTSYDADIDRLSGYNMDFSINLDATDKYIHVSGGNYADGNTVVMWAGAEGTYAGDSNALFTFGTQTHDLRSFWQPFYSGKNQLYMTGYKSGGDVDIRPGYLNTVYNNQAWSISPIWN